MIQGGFETLTFVATEVQPEKLRIVGSYATVSNHSVAYSTPDPILTSYIGLICIFDLKLVVQGSHYIHLMSSDNNENRFVDCDSLGNVTE